MTKEELKPLIPAFDKLSSMMKALFSSEEVVIEEPKKFTDAEAQDGTKIQIEGEIAPGSKVKVLLEDGTYVPAPDGELVLSDSSTLSIKDGLIVEVKAPQDPANTGEMKEQPFAKEVESLQSKITELSDKLAAYEKANAILMSKIEKTNNVVSETFKVVEILAGLPAENPIQENKQFFKKEDKLNLIANQLRNIKSKN